MIDERRQRVARIFTQALAREHADPAVRASEQRFRLLVELSPEAILVHDF